MLAGLRWKDTPYCLQYRRGHYHTGTTYTTATHSTIRHYSCKKTRPSKVAYINFSDRVPSELPTMQPDKTSSEEHNEQLKGKLPQRIEEGDENLR